MSAIYVLAFLFGSEYVVQRLHAAPTTMSRFPIGCVFTTLTMAGSSNYFIEDSLVSSVSVSERKRKVKTACQIVTVLHQQFGKRFPRRAALF
jgi:hypothetical protein